MCLGVWLVAFVMELPNFLGWGRHTYDEKSRNCLWDRKHSYTYVMFFSFIGIGTPVLLIMIFHLKVFLYVRKHEFKVQPSQQGGNSGQAREAKRSIRLSKTLSLIFLVFCVCWSPYAILVLIDASDEAPHWVYIFVVLLAHTNSSLNFVLYGATNRDFRSGYRKVFVLATPFIKRPRGMADPNVTLATTQPQVSQITHKKH